MPAWDKCQCPQTCGPAAPTTPKSLFEVKILGPHPALLYRKLWEWVPASVLNKPSSGSGALTPQSRDPGRPISVRELTVPPFLHTMTTLNKMSHLVSESSTQQELALRSWHSG